VYFAVTRVGCPEQQIVIVVNGEVVGDLRFRVLLSERT
jgi:hypothetical protein